MEYAFYIICSAIDLISPVSSRGVYGHKGPNPATIASGWNRKDLHPEARGVLHRDLQKGNVNIVGERLVVLDLDKATHTTDNNRHKEAKQWHQENKKQGSKRQVATATGRTCV